MFVSFLLPYIDRGHGPIFHWVMLKQLEALENQVVLVGDERYFSRSAPWDQPMATGGFSFRCPPRERLDRTRKCAIPLGIFNELEARTRSQLDAFRILLTEDYAPLQEALIGILETLRQEEPIEAILTWCNTPSLMRAAEHFHLPVIHNECGPFRPPLYQNTFYFDFNGVNGNTSAAAEIAQFLREAKEWPDFQPLPLEQIRALLARAPHVAASVPLEPRFKAGVALQVEDDSNLVAFSGGLTNFEAIFAARKGLLPSELLVRRHPLGHANYSTQLAVTDDSPDSVVFLRKCEQVVTINSSVAFECLLQDKPVRVLGQSPAAALSWEKFSRLGEQDRLLALNFLFIGHLVPEKFFYDADYYRWRLTGPSLRERYAKHLDALRHSAGQAGEYSRPGSSPEPRLAACPNPSLAAAEAPSNSLAPSILSHANGSSNGTLADKKILFVSHEASRTGAPMFLLRLLQWVRKNTRQQFEVLLARGGPLEAEFEKLCPTHKPWAQRLSSSMFRKFDLIYSNTCCNGALLEKLDCGHVPILTHLHELDYGIDAGGAKNIAAVLKQSNHFIACAQAVADRFCHRFNIASERMSVHHAMISAPLVLADANSTPASALRQKYDLPENAFVLASCGTFDLRKAPDLFLQLASRLKREVGIERPLRFIWIGKRDEVEPGRILDHDVRRLGLQKEVRFVGELALPYPLLALADVFCLTSREDPFPLVMLESAALGKPIVSFEGSGGCVEFCDFGGGITVPFLDVAGMANVCLELMRNPKRRVDIGQLAATTVQTRFDFEVGAPHLWQTVEALLRRPPPMSEYRLRDSSIEEIFQDWVPEEAPEKAYVQCCLGRRTVHAEAQKHLNAGRREAAIRTYMNGAFATLNSKEPLAVLEALLDFGGALAPLDSSNSAALLEQARTLAKSLGRPFELPKPGPTTVSSAAASGSTSQSRRPQAAATPQRPAVASPAPNTSQKRNPGSASDIGSGVPLVSIIIPTFNNLPLTRQCLESISHNTPTVAHEVILVDNASTDGTLQFLREREKAGELRLIANPRNEGFARACNQGAQAARGSLLLFLNNDTQVIGGWLEALVQVAQRPEVGIVGARLLYADGSIQHAGIEFINGVPDHPHRHAAADSPAVNRYRELDMVTGACFLMRRDLFLQLAGFDEAFVNGVEDVDLCLRARSAGWEVVYEPKAVLYHLEGQSAGRFDHVQKNLQLFFQRWGKSFDQHSRLLVSKQPSVMLASRSALLSIASPAAAEAISVAWEGTFLDFGSLSCVNRELTRELETQPSLHLTRVSSQLPQAVPAALKALACTLKSKTPVPTSIVVRHAWPPDWRRPASGKLVVIQPWEYGVLPSEWVANSRHVDEFWVPSIHVRDVYVSSGVAAEKVKVVPNGIAPDQYHPDVAPMHLATQKRFKFLFVGGTIHRKGADVLLRTYLNSFTAQDDVCLVIKDFGGQTFYAGQTLEKVIEEARQRPGAPEILYLTEELPPAQVPGLYTACDCLVHPYRGEGFGLPILEAMACGLPVIVTAGGAADDFATEQFAYRIHACRKPIGDTISGMKLAAPGWLLEPDAEALATQMKWVIEHREEAQAKGRGASEYVRREWTWERAAQLAFARLQEITAKKRAEQEAIKKRRARQMAPIELPVTGRIGELGPARELLRAGKLVDAKNLVVTALKQRPFHPEAYLLLAEIAKAEKELTLAREHASRARQLAPKWKAAKEFLKTLAAAKSLGQSSTQHEARQRLSVCMIVKNEERFLAQCLASVRPLARQIVVVDTGSTDRTMEIAKEFGAEMYSFNWCDDFSAARNAALERATGDWILVLDADEELPPTSLDILKKEMRDPEVMAYRMPIIDKGKEDEGHSYVPRLFRNAPGLFFVGRVHEQAFSSVEVRRREWGLDSRLSNATIIHHGYDAQIQRDRAKNARNLNLLELALEEMPNEPHLLMQYGMELARSGQLETALENYWEAVHLLAALPAHQIMPELRESLLTQLATQLLTAKDFAGIQKLFQTPLAKSNRLTASMHFVMGLADMEQGRYAAAAEQMGEVMTKRGQKCLSPIHKDIRKGGPAHCLAICYTMLKEPAKALKTFQQGLAEDPQSRPLRYDYARFLAEQGEPVDAVKVLYELVKTHPDDTGAWILGAQVALTRPDLLEFAADWTGEAIKHCPNSEPLALLRAETLILSQDIEGGRQILRKAGVAGNAKYLAALVLCELLCNGRAEVPRNLEAKVSQEFFQWYRNFLRLNAVKLVQGLNERVATLRQVLPSAAEVLEQALLEAEVEAAA